MANEIKTPRVTKAQRFEDIAALLAGETAPNGSTVSDLQAFVAHEVELLASKNASAAKRKNAEGEKNERLKALIVDYLATLDPENPGLQCSAIGKAVDGLADYNTSKLSSLCNALVADGVVVKSKGKGGASLFKLA